MLMSERASYIMYVLLIRCGDADKSAFSAPPWRHGCDNSTLTVLHMTGPTVREILSEMSADVVSGVSFAKTVLAGKAVAAQQGSWNVRRQPITQRGSVGAAVRRSSQHHMSILVSRQ